jgi:hypothetical protein
MEKNDFQQPDMWAERPYPVVPEYQDPVFIQNKIKIKKYHKNKLLEVKLLLINFKRNRFMLEKY